MMHLALGLHAMIVVMGRFFRDRRAASAVEFALVAAPFFYLLMGITQVGIFYIAQSALDIGVSNTALTLRANFNTGTTAVLPDAGTLKSSVAASSGSMVANNSALAVEIRQLTSLASGSVPIVDGTVDYGSNTSTLVLRAQSTVVTLAPGLGGLNTVYSSALVRRQGT
jgi:Flp pilus assembly protein TadG